MQLAERSAAPRIHYAFRCFDKDGNVKWEEEFDNLVTTVGGDTLLDSFFGNTAPPATWYAGLITVGGTVTGESVGTGDGTTTTFTHTLAHTPVDASNLTITAGSVTATDDGNGNLTGTGVSSGTVNYTTGAVSITFSAAPANTTAITAGYTYAPAFALADTMASHADWTEFTAYSQTARPSASWSAASGKSKTTSASLVFSINGSGGTVAGAFTATDSTKGGTVGTLYSEGSFKNGNGNGTSKKVSNGDTLNVSLTLSV